MKPATVLRSVKLYKPAKWVVDSSFNFATRVKLAFYRQKIKKHRKCSSFSERDKILVDLKDDGIGNSVEATPLVQAIRMLWPGSEITLLVPECDLYDNWCVPDLVTSDVEVIKNTFFDKIFLPFFSTWKMPDWLDSIDCGQIYKPKLKFGKRCLKPEREYNLDPLRKLGYKGLTPPLYVSIKKPCDLELSEKKRICILPCGKHEKRWQNKRWPYYFELIELFSKKYPDSEICIIGTAQDTVKDEILSLDQVKDLRGKLTLAETSWVLKSSDFVVGNDCGPMHIADAVGTPGICIFGPTCELKNSPSNKIRTVQLNLSCRPCQYDGPITCQEPKCMEDLKAKMVMEIIEKDNFRR